MTSGEIAAALNMAINALKVASLRAHLRLRELLDKVDYLIWVKLRRLSHVDRAEPAVTAAFGDPRKVRD
jgi:hypothetical protein